MHEREVNPIKRLLRIPIVRGVAGGILMLGGSLGICYGVVDYTGIAIGGFRQELGQEMDRQGVSAPASWDQAYKEIMKEDRNLRIKAMGDFILGIGGIAIILAGKRITSS